MPEHVKAMGMDHVAPELSAVQDWAVSNEMEASVSHVHSSTLGATAQTNAAPI
jgi:hypothetical protein